MTDISNVGPQNENELLHQDPLWRGSHQSCNQGDLGSRRETTACPIPSVSTEDNIAFDKDNGTSMGLVITLKLVEVERHQSNISTTGLV